MDIFWETYPRGLSFRWTVYRVVMLVNIDILIALAFLCGGLVFCFSHSWPFLQVVWWSRCWTWTVLSWNCFSFRWTFFWETYPRVLSFRWTVYIVVMLVNVDILLALAFLCGGLLFQ